MDTSALAGEQDRVPALPWTNIAIIGAVLIIAIGSFVTSLLATTSRTQSIGHESIGPISTAPRTPSSVPINVADLAPNTTTYHVQLRFRIEQLTPNESVFHIGTASVGVTAVVSTPLHGFSTVVLTSLDTLHPFSAVLVDQVRAGESYSTSIWIYDDHGIAASTNGHLQFTYAYLDTSLIPHLSGMTIGAGPGESSPLHGTVSNFSLTLQRFRVNESAMPVLALKILLGLLILCAFALCIIRLANGRRSLRRLQSGSPGGVEPRGRFPLLHRHSTLFGVAVLGGGVTLLAVFTPLDNTVLQKTGAQYFSAAPVGPHNRTSYSLNNESRLFRQAAALDVTLTFEVRLDRPKPPLLGSPVVVSTFGNDSGLIFQMVRTDGMSQLISLMGGDGNILLPFQRLLIPDMPIHRWVTVSAVVQRSQSFRYYVDGQPTQTFTWNLPILSAAPTKLDVNGTFGGSVRNLEMNVSLFRVEPNRIPFLLIRLAQGLGLFAIIGSTIVLCRRFLSKLVPTARPHKPLLLVTFWTMGVGIALNIVIDLLHFQRNTNSYAGRNTWLVSQYPRFNDFFQVYEILRSFNPYGVQNGSYPPLGYWMVAPLIWMNEYAALFTMIGLTVGFIVWWSYRSFTFGLPTYGRVLVVVIVLFSLPVSFAVDRANIDLLIFVLIALGIASLERLRPTLATACIGIAAAAKIYPIVYLLVFLRKRRLWYIILGCLIAAAASILTLSLLRASFIQNVDGFRSAYSALQTQLAGGVTATYFNASIPGWLQGIGYAVVGGHGPQLVHNALQPWVFPVELVAGLVLAAYLRWYEESLWRAVTLITTFILLFSSLSYYYELLFVFIALALFVRHARPNSTTTVLAVLFGVCLAPRAYFYLGNTMIDVSVLMTAPLLIGITIAVICDGHRERSALQECSVFNSLAGAVSSSNPNMSAIPSGRIQ